MPPEVVTAPGRRSSAWTLAIRRVTADPRVVWSIVIVLAVRLVVLNVIVGGRPDATSFLDAGARWLRDPTHLYSGVAAYVGRTHLGPAEGLVGPPLGAVLAAPFSLLPRSAGIVAWTLADCACVALALYLVDRRLDLRGSLRAWYWAVALVFPPLFAETQASQITGFILVLGCCAMVVAERRPVVVGVLAAVGAGLKLYPAVWVFGVRPRAWVRSGAGLLVGGAVGVLVGFGPLGVAPTVGYIRDVLVPVLGSAHPDCQIVSVSTFWERLLGGTPYPVLDNERVVSRQIGPHWPTAAAVLTIVTLLAIVVAALWASRASGWNPLYSTGLMVALGGLIPGELRTYQILPLLPLVLVVAVAAVRGARIKPLVVFACAGAAILVQPCSLVFPNLWTIAIVVAFAVCVSQARWFR